MKTRFTISALFAMALVFTSNINAATITTGGLTYDDSTHVITGTDGTSYLSWDQAASLNYAQTLAATDVGGAYEAYHIASQTEAYNFYNLAILPTAGVVDAPFEQTFNTLSASFYDGIFGANYNDEHDFAWFLSDENEQVGKLNVHSPGALKLDDYYGSISDSDAYSGGQTVTHATWLLVSDSNLIATPIPAALFMFAPALLGFFGFRRKMQA